MIRRFPKKSLIVFLVTIILVSFVLIKFVIAVDSQTIVSKNSAGDQANDESDSPSISQNGKLITFASYATNLVTPNTEVNRINIFLRNIDASNTELLSVSTSGTRANDNSYFPSISADGRFVVFESWANNLVDTDTNDLADIFIRDTQLDETSRISISSSGVQALVGHSGSPSISSNGRYVVFESEANNLVTNDNNNMRDIFLRDTLLNTTARISTNSSGTEANGVSSSPTISSDGTLVAFESAATNLVSGESNLYVDIFLKNTQTGQISRLSEHTNDTQANGDSHSPSISLDGKFVAYESAASNLVDTDTNSAYDIFLSNVDSDTTSRMSTTSTGVQSTGGENRSPSISASGKFVAFYSFANLGITPNNGKSHIYVKNKDEGSIIRISSVPDSSTPANNDNNSPAISPGGNNIVFKSSATNLVGGANGNSHIFQAYEDTLVDNTGPQISVTSGDVNFIEGQTDTFTLTSTDPDDDYISLTVDTETLALLSGATMNPVLPIEGYSPISSVFSWTPGMQDAGNHIVHFESTDPMQFTDHEDLIITVSDITPPVLDPIGNKSINETDTLTFSVNASEPDSDTLTYSADSDLGTPGEQLPPGATFNPTTKQFNWITSSTQAGAYNFRFQVSDGSNTDFEDITITVIDINPPVLQPISDKMGSEASLLSFTLNVTNGDNDPLIFSGDYDPGTPGNQLPNGSILDTNTGEFNWTPGYFQAGSYDIVFSTTDGSTTDTETAHITINNTNRPPVLSSIGNKSLDETATLTFTINGTDPDLETVYYSASNLPPGSTFDTETAQFNWTPTGSQAGTYTNVHFETTDGDLIDSEDITITVNDITSPVLDAIGNKSVNETDTLTFTLGATDVHGDPLSYSASNLPAGSTFDTATAQFSWTPTGNQSGTYNNINFEVTDGYSQPDSETITITVVDITPPVLDPIGNKSVNETDTLTFTISGTDVHGDPLIYSATGTAIDNGAIFNPITRELSWTTGPQQAGNYNVHFEVTDGSWIDFEDIMITVVDVTPPELSVIPNQSVDEGQLLTFPLLISSNPDSDTLVFSTNDTATAGLTVNPNTGVVSWTPGYSQHGNYDVIFSVTDGNNIDTETANIDVIDTNGPPVLDLIGPQSVNESDTLNFTISGSDPDFDPLIFRASNLPAGSTFDTDTRQFSWTPTGSQAGTYPNVHFEIEDIPSVGNSIITSEDITITVNDTTTPSITPIGDKSVNENENLTFTVNATDVHNDPITYSASNLPPGSTFDTETAQFSWTPGYEQAGTYSNIEFKATDNANNTGTEYITITANNVNRTPTLNAVGNKTVNEGSTLMFYTTGSDIDGTTVTYSASNLPSGAVFNTITGQLIWTPSYFQAGTYYISFQVTDGSLNNSETISITVYNVKIKTYLSRYAKPSKVKKGYVVLLYGKLYWSGGKPVTGKYIHIYKNKKRIKTVKTNSKGMYYFKYRLYGTAYFYFKFKGDYNYRAINSRTLKVVAY